MAWYSFSSVSLVYLLLVDGNVQLLVDVDLQPNAARAGGAAAAPSLELTDGQRQFDT